MLSRRKNLKSFILLLTIFIIILLFVLICTRDIEQPRECIQFFASNTTHARRLRIDGMSAIVTPEACHDSSSPAPQYLTYIYTAPGNRHQRNRIRFTWANYHYYPKQLFRRMFVVGVSHNSSVNEAIRNEAELHGDILFLNFTDSYRNLPYKAVLTWKYIVNNCRKVKNIIKVDDDVLDINMRGIQDKVSRIVAEDFLYCTVHTQFEVHRDRKVEGYAKWYVTEDEYPRCIPDEYPAYCHGVLSVLPFSTLEALYKQVPYTPFFWIDDIYVTGLLRNNLLQQPKLYDMERPLIAGDV